MNHNKKRNSAFLYEILLREGTKATLEKNVIRAKEIKNIILEHFNSSTEIFKELELYKCLKENIIEEELAERYLKEIQNRYDKLNKLNLFNEQTKLINKINKQLGSYIFDNFIPNYKDLATISQVFNPKTKVKEKILLEKNILEKIKLLKEKKQEKNLQNLNNIIFKTFSNKFNEKYNNLLNEQKKLLSSYINSFSNNSVEFKIYLNEELERLKNIVKESFRIEEINNDDTMLNKAKQTYDFLESFKNIKDLNQEMLQKILKIQEFVHEVSKK